MAASRGLKALRESDYKQANPPLSARELLAAEDLLGPVLSNLRVAQDTGNPIDIGTIRWLDDVGTEHSMPAELADPLDIVDGLPWRSSNNHVGQPNIKGMEWVESGGGIISRESGIEALRLLGGEYRREALKTAPQPFQFVNADIDHIPDFMTVKRNGEIWTYDVRLLEDFDEEEQERMKAFAQCMRQLGWHHEMWNEISSARKHNVQYLGRTRFPEVIDPNVEDLARTLWNDDTYGTLESKMLAEGALPFLVRPAIDHLIWKGFFDIDMDARIDSLTSLRMGVRA